MAKIGWFFQRCLVLFSLAVVNFFFKVLNRTYVKGVENIPAGGGVLFLSNHLSYLDPPLIASTVINRHLKDMVYAPAKASLFKVPLFAQLISALGAFPIERSGRDISGMRKIASLMSTKKMLLFPEGARNRTGQIGEGARMIGGLIRMAKPVVVPAAIKGTDMVLGPAMIWPRPFKKIELIIGEPIDLSLEYKMSESKDAAEAITQKIMGAIKSLLAGQSAVTGG